MQSACRRIDTAIRQQPEVAHTSHFLVVVDGDVVIDEHYHGPQVADIFSVTKSVTATLLGIAIAEGRLESLDCPLTEFLCVKGLPSADHTLRHLLTMTRGSQADGDYEIDAVMARPAGWLEHIASAPQLDPPGARFRYDNGASHLLGAAIATVVGMSLADYASSRLFAPLGIRSWDWPRDPDGLPLGFAHLRLAAGDLAKLGKLWLDAGAWCGEQLVEANFARQMTIASSSGGPPEMCSYGYQLWVDDDTFFAGGWAGQHVIIVPWAQAVIVVTGDPQFEPGPPPTDRLAPDWRPARDLILRHLLPELRRVSS